MPKQTNQYHSVLIVSASGQFDALVRKSLTGYTSVDIRRSAAQARRSVLERYFDIVVIDAPLPDEPGGQFSIDVAEKSNASVLLVTPQSVYEDVLDRVTDHGILVVPKPSPRGRIDKAIRYLIALQNKIGDLERKAIAAEEKIEELRIIDKAKFMLMEEEHMTEDDAHRFIGKQAMDNGISRARAARKILDDFD